MRWRWGKGCVAPGRRGRRWGQWDYMVWTTRTSVTGTTTAFHSKEVFSWPATRPQIRHPDGWHAGGGGNRRGGEGDGFSTAFSSSTTSTSILTTRTSIAVATFTVVVLRKHSRRHATRSTFTFCRFHDGGTTTRTTWGRGGRRRKRGRRRRGREGGGRTRGRRGGKRER